MRYGMPEGSFCGSGIEQLRLPADFNFVGPIACENCKRLRIVDLTGTDIAAIWGSTFSHCAHLAQIWFPRKLRRIGQEAFLLCSSLQEVDTPPALLYIAARMNLGRIEIFAKNVTQHYLVVKMN